MASSNINPAQTAEQQKQKALLAGESGLFTTANEATKSSTDVGAIVAATDNASNLASSATTTHTGRANYVAGVSQTAAEKAAAAEAAANTAAENLKKRQALLGSDYGAALDVGNSSSMRRSLLGDNSTTFGN